MRVEIAYLLIFLIGVAVMTVVWLSRRYLRYHARLMRGHHDKPVWKPFWIR